MQRLLRLNIGLVLLGVGVAVAWVLSTSPGASLEALAGFRPLFAPLLVGLSIGCIGVRFVRWQYLLRRVEVRVPTRASATSYLASLVGIATPAHVGEAIRCVLLRRQFGVPLGLTFEVLVVERIFDVLALAAIGAAVAPGASLPFVIAVGGVAIVALAAAGLVRAAGYPVRTATALRRPQTFFVAFGLSLLAWGGAVLLLPLAAASIGQVVPVGGGVRVYALSTLLGAATLTPAGVGTTGTIAIFGVENFGLGIDESIAVVSIMRLMSTGLALAIGAVFLGGVFREFRNAKAAPANAAAHFDALGADYAGELSSHVWSHLLDRKTAMLSDALAASPGHGIDLGCGLGEQARALRERGHRVVGIDAARNLLLAGARATPMDQAAVPVANARIGRLPFADASFDYAYAVGVLHHLGGPEAQADALREVARVLAPGGLLLVHETNPRNPLYRLYMGYVFPILRSIDEGVEHWIEPGAWRGVAGFELRSTRYFTFLPDFTPGWLLPVATGIESRLEATPLRRWSAHYLVVLERQ